MLLTDITHRSTLKSIERHNIDPKLFDNIDQLRTHILKIRVSNINKLRREKNKDKTREYMKNYMKTYMKEYYKKNKDTKWGKNKQPPEYFKEYHRKKKLTKMETIKEELTKGDSMPSIQENQ
jgi:hypothetical protein